MVHFAIAFVGRVGSSYLQALIDSHPDAACLGEIVSHPPISEGTASEVQARLDERIGATGKPVAGFKLAFCSVPLPAGILETLAARHYRFVHIERRNKFDQYLSMRLAQVNGVWRSDRGAYDVTCIHLDPDDAIEMIRTYTSYETAIADRLSGAFPYHHVFYEDVVSGDALPGILEFLGLEPKPLTSVFHKQREASQRDSIANYAEVAAALEANGFGHFIDTSPTSSGGGETGVDKSGDQVSDKPPKKKKVDRLSQKLKRQSEDIRLLEDRIRILSQNQRDARRGGQGSSIGAPLPARGGPGLRRLMELVVPGNSRHPPAGTGQPDPVPPGACIPRQYRKTILRSPILAGDTPAEYLKDYVGPARRPADFSTLDQFLAVAYLDPDRLKPPLSQADLRVIAYMDDYKTRCAAAYSDRPQDECVSIVMPTHDRADIIADAILSVEMQSYRNWELIVVDDGSPSDATAAAVAEFDDPRIRYVRLDTPSGNGAARNAGLGHARGPVIAYLDDDDQWDPDHLLVTLNQMRDSGRKSAYAGQIVWSGFDERLGIGQKLAAIRFAPFNRSLLENVNYISMISFIHDADLLQQTGTFDETLDRYLDWDLFLRMTEVSVPLAIPAITSHYYRGRTDSYVSGAPERDAAIAAVRQRMAERSGWTVAIRIGPEASYEGFANPARSREARRALRDAMPASPVEILIPNYECADELEACIASIEQCTTGPFGVTIVDNGSSPQTIERLSDFCAGKPFVSFVVDDGPAGFSHAINRGLAEIGWTATTDILVLNNDTIVTPDWLEEMQFVLWRHPDVGMAVPRQVLLPGSRIIHSHVPCAVDARECDTNVSQIHRNVFDRAFDPGHGLVELTFAPLFAGLIRGGVLQQLSGLNARNGAHYRSDWIFCDALRRILQMRIVYTPHSKIYHLQGVASREHPAFK